MDAESYDKIALVSEVGRSQVSFLSKFKGYYKTSTSYRMSKFEPIYIDNPLGLYFPNHTQSVERAVKETTAYSSRIAGHSRQIGEVLCKIAARRKLWMRKNIEVTTVKLPATK